MPFYENYVRLCNQINKSPSAVAIELKIAKPSVTRWKAGAKPRYATALRVANYFGVTVEELMGEGIKKEPAENGKLNPDYLKLNDANRAAIDAAIAALLTSQQQGD